MDFTWNGVTAASKGIVVTSLPPIQTATARNEEHVIPYRNGVLHIQDGTYDELIKQVGVYLPYEQGGSVTQLNAIKAWLSGSGTVVFSDQSNRQYRASVISQIDYAQWVTDFSDREAVVTFQCEPFAYHTGVSDITVTSGNDTPITNPGTYESQPKLTIRGSGNVSIMIGQTIFDMTGLSSSQDIVVDCEEMECYQETSGVRTAKNSMMSGEFPAIPVGTSYVAWTGSVTQIVISPRWRDL